MCHGRNLTSSFGVPCHGSFAINSEWTQILTKGEEVHFVKGRDFQCPGNKNIKISGDF